MTAGYAGRFGPLALEEGYRFRLFAPALTQAEVEVDGRVLRMEPGEHGWFAADDPRAKPGSRYRFVAGDLRVPDPGSRFQPDGVHGASEIVATAFDWPDDGWRGRPMHEYAIYELHVGTFTPEGTYAAAAARLGDLAALGITAVELMPLAAFPGARNWGYDGVLPYAPFAGYGRPDDLRRFIAGAHAHGLAVVLDVVYNHFGPEGNYLHALAPAFFNPERHTPWGAAIDVTHPDVRAFFAENAAYWLEEFRFDGLRFDATNTIVDPQSPAFLHEVRTTALAACAPERIVALVVENDDNDAVLLDDGFDAQWNDDAHHAAHAIVTGERGGYYADYAADPLGYLARTLTSGFGYQGEPSAYRGGVPRGSQSARFPLSSFVTFLQNHDQIGNRAFGERLTALAEPAAVRAAQAMFYLAPSPPLLFMGEEWAASTPFLFFCDFEPRLASDVTAGRRREFAAFPQFADPAVRERIPDPSAEATFVASQLRWEERAEAPHRDALAYATGLLQTRARHVAPFVATVRGSDATFERIGTSGIALHWRSADGTLHADVHLGGTASSGFAERLPGATFFASHGAAYDGGIAPPWAVRWSRT